MAGSRSPKRLPNLGAHPRTAVVERGGGGVTSPASWEAPSGPVKPICSIASRSIEGLRISGGLAPSPESALLALFASPAPSRTGLCLSISPALFVRSVLREHRCPSVMPASISSVACSRVNTQSSYTHANQTSTSLSVIGESPVSLSLPKLHLRWSSLRASSTVQSLRQRVQRLRPPLSST